MADYSFQKDAVKAVSNILKKHDRCRLYLPPGSGKTRTSLKIHDQLNSTLTVYIVPSLNLLGQTYREWHDHRKWWFRSLGICSDQEVANIPDFEDQYTLNVTTSVADVSRFMRRIEYKVMFITYHSLPIIMAAQSKTGIEIDFAIFDEAHRTVGMHDKHFAKGIRQENLNCRKRLFQTATPRYIDEKYGNELVCTMDDVEKYGPVAYKMSFREAIERGTLCDYQVAISVVSKKHVGNIVKNAAIGNASFKTISLYQAIHKHKLKKGITYHNTIRNSRAFTDHFQAAQKLMNTGIKKPNVQSTFIHSGSSVNDKQNALQMLSPDNKQRAFISNCKLYSEGVNIPNLDFIAIIDEKSSMVDIIQNIGRVLRTADGKNIGTVVIPVLLDDGSDAHEIDFTSFRPISRVLEALKAHDDMLAEFIDTLNSNVRISPQRRTVLTGEVERRVRVEGINVDQDTLLLYRKAVVSRIVDITPRALNFMKNFNTIKKHYIDDDEKFLNNEMIRWCCTVRMTRKKGMLSQDRIDLLDSINFEWTPRDTAWDQKITMYKAIIKATGDWPYTGEQKHIVWISRTRRQLRNGYLSEHQVKTLRDLNFEFSPHDAAWMKNYNDLKRHLTTYSRYPSAKEGKTLCNWILRMRMMYRRNELPSERVQLLNSISFRWKPDRNMKT